MTIKNTRVVHICDFCGQDQDSRDCIVAGDGVDICDQCVDVCKQIVEEHRAGKEVK